MHLDCVCANKSAGIHCFLLHQRAPGAVFRHDPFSKNQSVLGQKGVIPYRNHPELFVHEELHLHEGTPGVLGCHYRSQGKKHFDFLSQFGHG